MESKILNPKWFYDEMLNAFNFGVVSYGEQVEEFEQTKRGFDREMKKIEGAIRKGYMAPEAQAALEENISRTQENEELRKTILVNLDFSKGKLQDALESHPFIIGPATLESLVNEIPKSYESMTAGKLPFDNIFFEFAEPLELGMPFTQLKYPGRGISLRKDVHQQKFIYELSLYYKFKELIMSIQINFEPGRPSSFMGSVKTRFASTSKLLENEQGLRVLGYPPNFVTFFYIENNAEYARSCSNLKFYTDFRAGTVRIDQAFSERQEVSSIPNNEIFRQIPNLCTNLVNYINAHNVTVIKKEREIVELVRDDRNKKKKKESKRPFYLITIQDRVYEEPDEPRYTGQWKLEERIFVRGHDRRYRDDLGNIRVTSWIPPCIKGPPDAPFREQRYQVLYDKLRKEKEMMEKYGVKSGPYSPDLVMPGSSRGKF